MLTKVEESSRTTMMPALSSGSGAIHDRSLKTSQLTRMLRIEWIGQTTASLCWIASVLAYGISSTGDWLQLAAASAWLLANLAALVSSEVD